MLSFSNKYINQYNLLTNAVIGFEFEFFTDYSYVKLMELVNLYFSPDKEIWGFNSYHSSMQPTDKKWKIEPDYSGGSDMIELITGPMDYVEARFMLVKCLSFIQKYGKTDDHCSIHINISFKDQNVQNMNPVKLILNFNEDYVYSKFPNRKNNIYAQSIKWIIPFTDWEDSETAANSIVGGMQIPDDTKYYGINIQKKWKGWLEYRYIGGKDYQYKIDDICDLMDYFVIQTLSAITDPLNDEDSIKLLSYLEDGIAWYKQWQTYDDFLANIDNIKIEIDQQDDYETIKNGWTLFWLKLFVIVKQCGNIANCTINYNTSTNKIEIVGGNLEDIHNISNVDFIDCTILNATLLKCQLIDCKFKNGHIYDSKVYGTIVENAKLTNAKCEEWSKLINCMFDSGRLDCDMEGGVFRSGEIGENAQITNSVKMANKETFWSVWSPEDKMIKKFKK